MNNEMITANGCNYIDDFLEHKNGLKYKDKYMGPSGKWVYVYSQAKKAYGGYKKNKKYIDAGSKFILGKY